MEKIELREINFSKLEKLGQQGVQSTVYRYQNTCIKILDKSLPEEKQMIHDKILALDGIKIEEAIFPKKLILENGTLAGYTMDYFENSKSLFDYCFIGKYLNVENVLNAIKGTSLALRKLHKKEILYTDLSFDNVLIDDKRNIKFCDMDGCSYKWYTATATTSLLIDYIMKYKGAEEIILSKNTDRLSLMLLFYAMMYQKEIQNISKRQYKRLSKKIPTLKAMQKYAKILTDKKVVQPEVPYMDELINIADIEQAKTKRKYII